VSRHALRSALAALLLLAAAPAAAHETLHEIARGKAIAVKAWFADGEPLAYTAYEVYSPADPKTPWQKGRTDRSGWLAFVPDLPGGWRIRVIDETGHGLDLQVEASATGQVPAAGGGEVTSAAYLLRPLLGLAAIGVVFAAMFLAYRKKGRGP